MESSGTNRGWSPAGQWWCNVGLMSLTGLGPKPGSRHKCLIIAWTGQQGPVLYKMDKAVSVAAGPPEGGPAKTGDLTSLDIIFPYTDDVSLVTKLYNADFLLLSLSIYMNIINFFSQHIFRKITPVWKNTELYFARYTH